MQNAFHFACLGIRALLKKNYKTSSFRNYFDCISNKSDFSAYFVAVKVAVSGHFSEGRTIRNILDSSCPGLFIV